MTISVLTAAAAAGMFITVMIAAALMDIATMKIPNGLIILLVLPYPVLAPLAGFGPAEMGLSAATASAVLLGAFSFFALGWVGGGDAKLAAATALWFGTDYTIVYLIYTALFGGVLTLCLLQFRMVPLPATLEARPWIAKLQSAQTGVPYGVAMAAAALVVFPGTHWMTPL